MRILWLAGAGALALAGQALAQGPPVTIQPQPPVGVMGVPGAPTTFLGGNNVLNQDGSAWGHQQIGGPANGLVPPSLRRGSVPP